MSQQSVVGSRICLLLWVLAGSLLPASLAAQSDESSEASAASPGDPAGYRQIVNEAVREFAAHNYEESRSLFRRAHVLHPNARTHRGLGLAEFELRNYGECIRHLEAALQSSIKPLTAELRDDTARMLTRANGFVARVVLNVRPDVSRVVVDGVALQLPASEALVLRIGEHTLELQAPGFVTEKRKLNVQGGELQTLNIVLVNAPAPLVNTPAPLVYTRAPVSEPPKETRRWYKSPWLWAAVGVVVVGASAAGVGYAAARGNEPTPASGGTTATVLRGPR
jgi:hypothetical protein